MREGKILNPEKLFFDEKGSADVQLDCKGCILAPGFIDVQINGEVHAAAPSSVLGRMDGVGWVCAVRTSGIWGRSAGEAFLLPGCAVQSWRLALLTPNGSTAFWGWESSGAAPVPCWARAGDGALGSTAWLLRILRLHLCFVHGAGGFGVDFSLATDDFRSGIDLVGQKILSHGVTSFCPTLVTSPPSVYHQVSDFLHLLSLG